MSGAWVICGNLSALTNLSVQFVVEITLSTAARRIARTSGEVIRLGIMQTRLTARSNSGFASAAPTPGLEQWMVRESHKSMSPAAIAQVIGGVAASIGSSAG